LAIAVGCGDRARRAEESASLPAAPPPLAFAATTTPGETALANLEAQITAAEAAVARRPDVMGFRAELAGALLTRVGFRGSFADFARLDALTAEAVTAAPGEAAVHVLRARFLSAVHDFAGAFRALDRAERLGERGLDLERSTYELALGVEVARAFEVRRAEAEAHPGYRSFVDLAAALAARGDFVRADDVYRAALDRYRDVSPFPVAWVFFQRGVMWAEMAGRPDWALPLYEEAVRRLPGYVSANVHLGELEARSDPSRAIERLRPIAEATQDPEPAARLAGWLGETAPTEAARFAERARAGYEALLARHPAAFADHAAEFFAGAGQDPARALALAEENLTRRQTPRAYLLAIEMAFAAGAADRACALVARVPPAAAAANLLLRRLVEDRKLCP
jgi:tetratricopeptide (TPR) repeat protein